MSTKNRIIETVEKQLSRDFNYDNISMSAIAEEIGIAKSTIYEYFSSKKQMMIEVTMHLFEDIINKIISFPIDGLTFKECFLKQMDAIIDMALKSKATVELIQKNTITEDIKENHNICENAKLFFNKIYIRIYNILCKGVEEGTIKFSGDQDFAEIYFGFLIGNIYNYVNNCKMDREKFNSLVYEGTVKLFN